MLAAAYLYFCAVERGEHSIRIALLYDGTAVLSCTE